MKLGKKLQDPAQREIVCERFKLQKENQGRDSSSIFKTFVSSKYNFYANLILMDFLNGEINNLNQEKKKFCFLIYFLFWLKLSNMAFYKKLKC